MSRWNNVLIAAELRAPEVRDDDTVYPPFKLASTCPKCNHTGDMGRRHSVTFHASTLIRRSLTLAILRPELIERQCHRCYASWFQLPADASGKTAQTTMKSCCDSHRPGHCCDADDCASCCEYCPDACALDTGKRGKPDHDPGTLAGFAAYLANEINAVRLGHTVRYDAVADTSEYVYRVPDPGRMVFVAEHYDEAGDGTVRDAVFEVSVRRVS